jgi:hypothetical protein
VQELWTQLNVLDPESFQAERDFIKRYCMAKKSKVRQRPGGPI